MLVGMFLLIMNKSSVMQSNFWVRQSKLFYFVFSSALLPDIWCVKIYDFEMSISKVL